MLTELLTRRCRAAAWTTLLAAFVLPIFPMEPPLAAQELDYIDVTREMGLGLPEGTLNESLAWGDYDNDGDPDLFLSIDGPSRLYRNDGDRFTDVTAVAGTGTEAFSVGAAWADLDNDGDLDLYVVSFRLGPDVLYRNDGPIGPGGEHVFTDVSRLSNIAQQPNQSSSRGVAFLDFDRDGLLDIYVNAIGFDLLYRNRGKLIFQEVSGPRGVNVPGQGVGAVASDLDNDGWIDLFTGNRSSDPNRLLQNVGGRFVDRTNSAGIDKVGLGMGVLSFDYDNDLDFDLYWTTWPNGFNPDNALYENLGELRFVDVALESGTTDRGGWGISCNAADVDNDGWEDFFITNGFDPGSTKNVLFRNNGDKTFSDVTGTLEGGGLFDGRGVGFSDFDRDGDIDMMVTGGPSAESRLYRNDTNNGHHWLILDLEGVVSNRSAIGARVEVVTALGSQVKEVSSGAGRGSFNDLPVEFGLGTAEVVERVVIRWPNGLVQTLEDVEVDQRRRVVEGLGMPFKR